MRRAYHYARHDTATAPVALSARSRVAAYSSRVERDSAVAQAECHVVTPLTRAEAGRLLVAIWLDATGERWSARAMLGEIAPEWMTASERATDGVA